MVDDQQDQESPVTQNELEEFHIAIAIDQLVKRCHMASYNAGWWHMWNTPAVKTAIPLHFAVPMKLALIHSEISEALEGFRKDKMDDHLPHRKSVEVELADAMIRILDLAGRLELDVAGALLEKMEYNAKRADHKVEARAAEGGKKF